MTYPAKRNLERCPAHPGAIIEDMVADMPVSRTRLAAMIGISRQHLYDILKERKAITPPIAARLGKLFGNGPGLWLRLQANHDAWHAEREIDVSAVVPLASVSQ